MKINEIIAKMLKGETITEEERTFLTVYQEPKQSADPRVEQLQAEIDRLTQEAEAAKNKGLPEVEQLKATVTQLTNKLAGMTKERDDAKASLTDLDFTGKVNALAATHKFAAEPSYLKHLIQTGKIDLSDEAAVTAFITKLKTDSPKFFAAEVNPGGGGTPNEKPKGGLPNKSVSPEGGNRIDKIVGDLQSAPEIK